MAFDASCLKFRFWGPFSVASLQHRTASGFAAVLGSDFAEVPNSGQPEQSEQPEQPEQFENADCLIDLSGQQSLHQARFLSVVD